MPGAGESSSKRKKIEKKSSSQTSFESSSRTKEDEQRVQMNIAYFFYDNGIPFNAARSKSYKKMIEAIGEYGPGFITPTAHELRKYCDRGNDANSMTETAGGDL